MVSVLELMVVAGMSVFLVAVMITLLGITTRLNNNAVSRSDARRELHTTLDGVMSELRNARGLATCLDQYESDSINITSTAECRKVQEGTVAVNAITDGGHRFCFFSYGVVEGDNGVERTLRAPGQVCVAAVDHDADHYRLELQRWDSPDENYFFFGDGEEEQEWLGAAQDEFDASTPPREVLGYLARSLNGTPVVPFQFLTASGTPLAVAADVVGANSTADAAQLGEVRIVEVSLAIPYDVKLRQATADQDAVTKYFSYTTAVALRGAIYEGEQNWEAIG